MITRYLECDRCGSVIGKPMDATEGVIIARFNYGEDHHEVDYSDEDNHFCGISCFRATVRDYRGKFDGFRVVRASDYKTGALISTE